MKIDKRMLEDILVWLAKQVDIPGGWLYIGDEKERYLLGQPGEISLIQGIILAIRFMTFRTL